MTVKNLKDHLQHYPDDMHVVVAMVPPRQMVVNVEGTKLEIAEVWQDKRGVCNLIASVEANEIDPDAIREAMQKG